MPKKSSAYSRSGHKHIHRDDAFTKTIEKVSEYYIKSPVQSIITTIAVIGILILVPILISKFTGGTKKAPPVEADIALLNSQQLMTQDLKAAEDTLRTLLLNYPRTIPGIKARYYLGEVLYKQQKFAEAREQYAQFEEIYPVKKSFLKEAAFFAQANCLEEEQNMPEAIKLYLELPDKYPKSAYTAFAYFGAGRCMILTGQLDEAEKLFTKMLDDFPEKDNRLIYKKALAELGKIDAIRHKY